MNTVLITGGGGFLGRHLANACAKDGLRVTVLDDLSCRNSSLRCKELNSAAINPIKGSIFDKNLMDSLIASHTHIVHFASVVGVGETIDHPIATANNLVGTLHLAASVTPDRVVVFGSSADVYGMHSEIYSRPMHEDDNVLYEHPPVGRWLYPMVKAVEEDVIAASPARSVAIRIFNCFGPGMDFPQPKRVIPQFLHAILHELPLRIHGSGEQQRTFCYYTDTIAGIRRALQFADGLPAGQHATFNIGNDKPIAVLQLATKMNCIAIEEGLLSRHLEIRVNQRDFYAKPFNDYWNRAPNLNRARNLLGYEPMVPLDEGLRHIMRWAKTLRTDSPSELESAQSCCVSA